MLAFGCGIAVAQSVDRAESGSAAGTDNSTDGDTVEVAYRTIDKSDIMGGTSWVDMNEMMSKSYGLSSLAYLDVVGGYGNGLWGMMSGPLILVDGFPRGLDNVQATEIESITVLKGAAAVVLHGPKAARGVVMITTKRGEIGERQINVRANTGFFVPKMFPKYLGSAEYMTLYNEARTNDGLQPLYSAEDIYNHGSGINPYRYPDHEFYTSDYLRKAYNRSDAMAEIKGGGERARYYTTVGYSRQGQLIKAGNAANDFLSHMFVRGNIDLSLHELISARVDASATFNDQNYSSGDFWGGAATLRPNRVTPLIPIDMVELNDTGSLEQLAATENIIDGKYFLGGTQLDQTNPIADLYAAGDGRLVTRQFQFDAKMDFNLRNAIDGLFFRAKYGIDYISLWTQDYTNTYATFQPSWTSHGGQDVIGSLTKYGEDLRTGNQNISDSGYENVQYFSAQFDWTRTVDSSHNMFALLVANGWQNQRSGQYHKYSNANLGLQLSYDFEKKYYADFSAAVPWSAKLPEGKRAGFSPTLTLGWRLTKESFLEESKVLDDLVLSLSGGIVAQDLDIMVSDNPMGYFLYEKVLRRGGWWAWADNGGEAATEYNRSNNPDMGYVKRKEISVSLRGSMWDRLFTFDLSWFYTRMDGLLTRPTSVYPSYFTQTGYPSSSLMPYINYNTDDYTGLDFSVYLNKKFGEVDIKLGFNGLYSANKAARRDEIYEYDYQRREGKTTYGLWGLESQGLFATDAEAASADQTFGPVQAGDIRYKDQDGDGKIDSNDQVLLGRQDTPLFLGLNLTAKWRNLTFFAMGYGAYGGTSMKSSSYYWMRSSSKYSVMARDRWTEATAATATYPRLTTTNNDNNLRASDFWTYKTNAFRLQHVQLTYDLPSEVFGNSWVKGMSVYVAGNNLLTISKERKHLETNVGVSPLTRFYNLGLKMLF
ncbi:MAG: SusC/RagA family TonB-linked outer membrane protein [Alistipes sp.]|nr:SusC/RagA family TonB-linked outer membrane protein [Alistipes sp.]